jgi:hypothetical protein
VALGFVEITRKGCAGNAGYRQSTWYRLTYRHAGSDKRITDEWRRIESPEGAEASAKAARTAMPEQRSKNKSPVRETPTGTGAGKPTNRGPSPVRETPTTSPVRETPTTSISRVGTPHLIDGCSTPDDGMAQGPPARPTDAGVAAPLFDLIEGSFHIGDRWIELSRSAAAPLSLTAGQLAQHLAALHPSNADKPVRPRLTVIAAAPTPAIAAE